MEINKKYFSRELQEYLSIGYLYLIVTGLVIDFIYYSLMGVRIMQFATIQDILMAPVKVLFYHPIMLITMVILATIQYFVLFGSPANVKKYLPEAVRNSIKSKMAPKSITENTLLGDALLRFLMPIILSVFVGFRVSGGVGTHLDLAKGIEKTDTRLIFSDNTIVDVRFIGQTETFLFYAPKGGHHVVAVHIENQVKSMQSLKKTL
jgi:hypothetical protein